MACHDKLHYAPPIRCSASFPAAAIRPARRSADAHDGAAARQAHERFVLALADRP